MNIVRTHSFLRELILWTHTVPYARCSLMEKGKGVWHVPSPDVSEAFTDSETWIFTYHGTAPLETCGPSWDFTEVFLWNTLQVFLGDLETLFSSRCIICNEGAWKRKMNWLLQATSWRLKRGPGWEFSTLPVSNMVWNTCWPHTNQNGYD